MNESKNSVLLPVISLLLSTVLAGTGCRFPAITGNQSNLLKSVEVNEYQGEKLSSISQFRDNSIKGPQLVDRATYHLTVEGLVKEPKVYSYDEVINNHQLYKKTVRLNCVEGWSVNILWEGVRVQDIVDASRAEYSARTVIFHSVDGYTTSLPLDYIRQNNLLLAYKMNDVTLPTERGFPFQLVAESKWGYKWIKWVTRIELSSDENYRGYWESRGYSNKADLKNNFFGE